MNAKVSSKNYLDTQVIKLGVEKKLVGFDEKDCVSG